MLGDDLPVPIHDLAAFAHQRGGVAPHEAARIAGGGEAELLRIGLRRDRQPEPLRDRSRVRLDEPADREE